MRRNTHATYQGRVEAAPGGWRAVDANGAAVAGVLGASVNYLDAEAVLLRLRTGRRSIVDYRWPRQLVADLRSGQRV